MWRVKERSYHSFQLTSSHLISTDLISYKPSLIITMTMMIARLAKVIWKQAASPFLTVVNGLVCYVLPVYHSATKMPQLLSKNAPFHGGLDPNLVHWFLVLSHYMHPLTKRPPQSANHVNHFCRTRGYDGRTERQNDTCHVTCSNRLLRWLKLRCVLMITG